MGTRSVEHGITDSHRRASPHLLGLALGVRPASSHSVSPSGIGGLGTGTPASPTPSGERWVSPQGLGMGGLSVGSVVGAPSPQSWAGGSLLYTQLSLQRRVPRRRLRVS